jgi:pimeloyl-ACP methyl ester carboxylesterase
VPETTPPPSQSTVAGDGLDLAVWKRGDRTGPTVVLVHGYPDTHHVWDGVAEALASEFHVVAYDVRGAGESGVPADRAGYDLDHLMADLTAVIDACSPDAPVHLVGHDWGSIQGWEAVTRPGLQDRIASYTSMSGPGLDHVSAWMRSHATLDRSRLRALVRQGVRSWYTAFFQIPRLAELGWRTFVPRGFGRYLQRVEGVAAGGTHPAPTLARDGAHGVELYRQNLRSRLSSPQPRTTDVPVLLVVATRDRFVTPALLDHTGDYAADLHRVDVDGGHWFPVAHSDRFAALVREHVLGVEAPRP